MAKEVLGQLVDLTKKMVDREESYKKREDDLKRKELEMCFGKKQRFEMYADEPAQSQTINEFDKQKRTVKETTAWLTCKATDYELNGPWVQFNDSPRITVDGLYLRSFIRREVDVDDSMGFAIARLLNKGLGSKESESGTTCQFLLHDWAARY